MTLVNHLPVTLCSNTPLFIVQHVATLAATFKMSCIFIHIRNHRVGYRGNLRRESVRDTLYSSLGGPTIMKHSKVTVRIIEASEVPECAWILSYRNGNRERFLGSYPSSQEAEQAQREEFGHLHRAFSVIGYDPRLLDAAFVA